MTTIEFRIVSFFGSLTEATLSYWLPLLKYFDRPTVLRYLTKICCCWCNGGWTTACLSTYDSTHWVQGETSNRAGFTLNWESRNSSFSKC
jgi:hypothetical protein